MSPSFGKAALGGAVGTIIFSLMGMFVAPRILGHPMDVPAMLAHMIGAPVMAGMLIHAFLGVIAFPFAYRYVFAFLPGPPILKGIIFAFGLFIVAESLVMPMAGNGFWSSTGGGIPAVMVAFMGHMVYGALLGIIAGGASTATKAA